ncbi:DeoR/GlpR family transcriptional regulator of sugar metabolism [Clostridium saccharobutylicum]|nr:DeoR/GlpR family transcriptional regulator of sugar metabolism [Clostridium saccharobutylicum]
MSKKLQRTNKIIEILKEKNGASVKELALTLGVSEMTIRRDLDVLKSNNIVNNVYGATIYNPSNNIQKLDNLYDITDEVVINEDKKSKIGKAAASLIEPDDLIIIDTGTTTEKLAQNISDDINLTALFYNTNILIALKSKKNINLIFLADTFILTHKCLKALKEFQLLKKQELQKPLYLLLESTIN